MCTRRLRPIPARSLRARMAGKAKEWLARHFGSKWPTHSSAPALTDIPMAAWPAARQRMRAAVAPTAILRQTIRTLAAVVAAMAELAGRAVRAGTALWVSEAWAALPFLRLSGGLAWAVAAAADPATTPPATIRPAAELSVAASSSFVPEALPERRL